MFNVMIIAIVMMALTTLYFISNNMWNHIAIADWAANNPFKARNLAENIVPVKEVAKAYFHLMRGETKAADTEINNFCSALDSKRLKSFEKKFVSSMMANTEEAAWKRYWWMLKLMYSEEEAEAAKNDSSKLKLKPKHVHKDANNAKKGEEFTKSRFFVAKQSNLNKRTAAKKASGIINMITENWDPSYMFVIDTTIEKVDDEGNVKKLPGNIKETITIDGHKYELFFYGQGGLKKGVAVYMRSDFLDQKINGDAQNRTIRDWADMVMALDLPINKRNQVRALINTSVRKTNAKSAQMIILPAKQREDVIENVIYSTAELKLSAKAKRKVVQALADGFCVGMPDCGMSHGIHQLRPSTKCLCYVMSKEEARPYIGIEVTDIFGRKCVVDECSIVTTTDNIKDITAYEKSEAGYKKWLSAQITPWLYECELHYTFGTIMLGRQNAQMFHQLTKAQLEHVLKRNMAKWMLIRCRDGFDMLCMQMFACLRQPELAPIMANPLMREVIKSKYLSAYQDILSGRWEIEGCNVYGIADPFWFMDVYCGRVQEDGTVKHFDVFSTEAGVVKKGEVFYGQSRKDKPNQFIGRRCCLSRFPQVKPGMPIVTVAGDACYGAIMFSMHPDDMCLQDLDADLDGDHFYMIFENSFVEAMEHSHKMFNWGHIIFDKPKALAKMATMNLAEFGMHNAELNMGNGKDKKPSSVGVFAKVQFAIWEAFCFCATVADVAKMLIPAMSRNGKEFEPIHVDKAEMNNAEKAVQGNLATDAGKGGFCVPKGECDEQHKFRGVSDRYAHPHKPDNSTNRMLLECFKWNKKHPEEQIDFGNFFWNRVWNFVVYREEKVNGKTVSYGYMRVKEHRINGVNDFIYDEYGKIIEDEVMDSAMYIYPSGKHMLDRNIYWHKFHTELDSVYTVNGKTQYGMFLYAPSRDNPYMTDERWNDFLNFICARIPEFKNEDWDKGIALSKYFATLNNEIAKEVKEQGEGADRDRGWSVEDNIAEEITTFARVWAMSRGYSADKEEGAWLAYNALCSEFLTNCKKPKKGTSFIFEKFLRLFNDMLVEQVCENAGREAPEKRGDSKMSSSDLMSQLRENEDMERKHEVTMPEMPSVEDVEEFISESSNETPREISDEEAAECAAMLEGGDLLGNTDGVDDHQCEDQLVDISEESVADAEAELAKYMANDNKKPKRKKWSFDNDDGETDED